MIYKAILVAIPVITAVASIGVILYTVISDEVRGAARKRQASKPKDPALYRAELVATLRELRRMYEQDPLCRGSRFEDVPIVQEVLAELRTLEETA